MSVHRRKALALLSLAVEAQTLTRGGLSAATLPLVGSGAAKARMFISYATGGADWYPDHLSFMFSRRNPARTALLTANWDPPEALKDLLAPLGCGYHYSQAMDILRMRSDGGTEVLSASDRLDPLQLYRLDHGDPPFMRGGVKRP